MEPRKAASNRHCRCSSQGCVFGGAGGRRHCQTTTLRPKKTRVKIFFCLTALTVSVPASAAAGQRRHYPPAVSWGIGRRNGECPQYRIRNVKTKTRINPIFETKRRTLVEAAGGRCAARTQFRSLWFAICRDDGSMGSRYRLGLPARRTFGSVSCAAQKVAESAETRPAGRPARRSGISVSRAAVAGPLRK